MKADMLRRVTILIAVLALSVMPATAWAASRDITSTHTYLLASYKAMHTAVSTWPSVEANIHKLELRFHAECPDVGAGSPQNVEDQKLAYEAVGALWATGYHTDAPSVRAYVKTLKRLIWSNPKITHEARRLARGLQEMTALQVPNICADVRAWRANSFGTAPANVKQYDEHVEGIEVYEIPRSLLAPYVKPADNGLRKQMEHFTARFEELEYRHGQDDWVALLGVLGVNM